MESSLTTAQTAASLAAKAVEEAQQAGTGAVAQAEQTLQNLVTQATAQAEQAAESAGRQAAVQAAALAEQAASTAGAAVSQAAAHAEVALAAAAQATAGPNARHVLEKLDDDYRLLSELVQALHTRIAGLAAATAAPPPPLEVVTSLDDMATAPQSDAATIEPGQAPAPAEAEEQETEAPAAASVTPLSWQAEAPLAEVSAPAAAVDEAEPEPETNADAPLPEPEVAPSLTAMSSESPPATAPPEPLAIEVTLAGKILANLAPVPDFDRLLNLAGALGRMAGVLNVTLADYTREEVSFQVELGEEIGADEFGRRLAEVTGYDLLVVAAAPDSIQLRLSGVGS